MPKYLKAFCLLSTLLSTHLTASPANIADMESTYTIASGAKSKTFTQLNDADYVRPVDVPVELWDSLKPYFLPTDSPLKPILDNIFTRDNILRSLNRFKVAGFNLCTSKKHKLVVAKHPDLEGYVVKAYLEKSPVNECKWWVKRIDGANAIREKISEYGYEEILKAPRKWIYPLPNTDRHARGRYPKNFILIAEDMDILKGSENSLAYRYQMDEFKLDALFQLITELHLRESVFIFNTPFSHDGKITFVDTEFSLEEPVLINFRELSHTLSPEMQQHLEYLIQNRYSP